MFIELPDSKVFNRPTLINLEQIVTVCSLHPNTVDKAQCLILFSTDNFKTTTSYEEVCKLISKAKGIYK